MNIDLSRCKIVPDTNWDEHYWVDSQIFLNDCIDRYDLSRRDSDAPAVLDAYHPGWFSTSPDGSTIFAPPVVRFEVDGAKVINGRHRITFLARNMPEIPIAVDPRFYAADAKHHLARIGARPLDLGTTFSLPSFPFLA